MKLCFVVSESSSSKDLHINTEECWGDPAVVSHFPRSADLWQAANFQAANCRREKHLPLHQPMFPALPPPLWVIGKECGFYQEIEALLISCSDGKKYTSFITALCMQDIHQTKEFTHSVDPRTTDPVIVWAVGFLVLWKLCGHFPSNIICRNLMPKQSNALPSASAEVILQQTEQQTGGGCLDETQPKQR